MTNIEIPEDIQNTVKRVLAGRELQLNTTVALAAFIRDLNKPEIVVEPFVIYKVEVHGEEDPRMGFRVDRDVPAPWVTLNSNSPYKEYAFGLTMENMIHKDDEVKVIERWSPEAPETKFGIGNPEDDVDTGKVVLVKGVLDSQYVDSDGDVRVVMDYSDGLTETHYVSAGDTAYFEEDHGN